MCWRIVASDLPVFDPIDKQFLLQYKFNSTPQITEKKSIITRLRQKNIHKIILLYLLVQCLFLSLHVDSCITRSITLELAQKSTWSDRKRHYTSKYNNNICMNFISIEYAWREQIPIQSLIIYCARSRLFHLRQSSFVHSF